MKSERKVSSDVMRVFGFERKCKKKEKKNEVTLGSGSSSSQVKESNIHFILFFLSFKIRTRGKKEGSVGSVS